MPTEPSPLDPAHPRRCTLVAPVLARALASRLLVAALAAPLALPAIPSLPTTLMAGSLAGGALLLPLDAAAAGREQAVSQALRASGRDSRVLGVRRSTDASGRAWWEVKVLSDGRVRVHRVPAD